jgi:Domain of unknown function (DUF1905)
MSTSQRFTVQCQAPVWLWAGKGAWHFVTLPLDAAEQLKEIDSISAHSLGKKLRRGWGSIPVQVRIGASSWHTSMFPDKQSGSYFLPLKAAVRKAECIVINDTVTLEISIPMP